MVRGREDVKTQSSKIKLRWKCFFLLIENRVSSVAYSDELRVNIYPVG